MCFCGLNKADFQNFNNNLRKFEEKFILNLAYEVEFQEQVKPVLLQSIKAEMDLAEKNNLSRKDIKLNEEKQQLKTELNLNVDQIKQGVGTTNGNTSRTFFNNYPIVSRILAISEDLLKRFYIILNVLNAKQNMKADLFEEFLKSTSLILKNWYPCTSLEELEKKVKNWEKMEEKE
uniref:Uncharacterized protein n=1 Tax=Megaselia scalaris TaxID=36166 RepID=T1GKF3_MEGSC